MSWLAHCEWPWARAVEIQGEVAPLAADLSLLRPVRGQVGHAMWSLKPIGTWCGRSMLCV